MRSARLRKSVFIHLNFELGTWNFELGTWNEDRAKKCPHGMRAGNSYQTALTRQSALSLYAIETGCRYAFINNRERRCLTDLARNNSFAGSG